GKDRRGASSQAVRRSPTALPSNTFVPGEALKVRCYSSWRVGRDKRFFRKRAGRCVDRHGTCTPPNSSEHRTVFGTNGLVRGSSAIRKFRSAAFADAPKDQWREPPPLPLLQGHRRPGRGDLQGARPAPPTRIPLPQPGCLGSAAEDRCPLYPSPPMTLRFRLRRPLAPPHGGPKQRGLPHRPSPSLRRGTLTRLARRRLV